MFKMIKSYKVITKIELFEPHVLLLTNWRGEGHGELLSIALSLAAVHRRFPQGIFPEEIIHCTYLPRACEQ